MRYFGGKQRLSNEIVEVLNSIRKPGQVYLEPFLGGGSIFCKMDNPKIGADVMPELIAFWQDVQAGWIPPDTVSREEYLLAKEEGITGGLRAFIGFGCSFGGKWFAGYASTKGRNYAQNARNSTLRKKPGFLGAEIVLKDFFSWDVVNYLIYCDPPYSGKTKPGSRNSFDHDQFWEHVRYLSRGNTVLVSETEAPEDFSVVWEKTVKTDMQQENRQRSEKLYLLGRK